MVAVLRSTESMGEVWKLTGLVSVKPKVIYEQEKMSL